MSTQIDEQFKAITIDLKNIFLEIKNFCKSQEALLIEREKRESFIKALGLQYYKNIDERFSILSKIADSFDINLFALHKSYVRSNIYPVIEDDSAKLNWQIDKKPLGYSGDFIVANYIYENGYSGTTLFGMFMDRYTLETPLAQAHMRRREHLKFIIYEELSHSSTDIFRVSSFACGSAPEAFDILSGNKRKDIYFTLVDGEPKAIDFLKKKAIQESILNENLSIIQSNLLLVLREKDSLNLPKQNFIYSAGFLDYMGSAIAKRLIQYMFDCLQENGVLLIINVSMHDKNNVYLKMLGEWPLHHRSEADLMDLVGNLNGNCKKEVWADKINGRNLYLKLRKISDV